MKQKKWFTKVLAFVLVVSLAWVPMGDMGSAHAAEGDIVTFSDSEMERYFLDQLGKSSGDTITEGELATITQIYNTGDYKITDYSALQYCTGLTRIHIVRAFDAEAMDLSFLENLGNPGDLKTLTLSLPTSEGNQRVVTNFSAIEKCTGITNLTISYMSSTEWDSISKLTKLESLDMSESDYTALPNCSNMTNLKSLRAYGSPYSGSATLTDISGIKNCNSLTSVDLGQSKALKDITPLAGKTGITELDLEAVYIADDNKSSYMSTIASLTGLVELEMSSVNLEDEHTSMFRNLSNLEKLVLNGNDLTNADFLTSNKSKLVQLNLANNPLTDASALGQLTNVERLYLAGTQVTDFSFISQMTNLKKSVYWSNDETKTFVYRTSADGSAIVIDNPVKNEKGQTVAPNTSDKYSYNAQTNQITVPLSSIAAYSGGVTGGITYTFSMTTVGGESLSVKHTMHPYVLGITAQPQDAEVNEGQSASLTVGLVGSSSKKLQWYKNGTAIAGATSGTLKATESGDYYAVITDTFSTLDTPLQVTSETATVTVNVPLAITTQPQGITLLEGESGSLSVEAKGMAPLKYQWYKDNVAISGATSATLALNNVTTATTGNYTVKVTDAKSGEITSTVATVTVNEKVKILTQPQGFTALEGDTKSLSVTVNGTAPISYQWCKDNVAISGATSSTLQFSNLTTADAGKYTVKITDKYSNVTSSAATVVVHKNLAITAQPQRLDLIEGESGKLSVTAEGQGTLKYQWYKDNVEISGATSATLQLSNAELADAGAYKVVVSDDNSAQNGTKTSSVVTVTVDKKLAITSQPQSITLVKGDSGSLSVAAVGQGTLTYQWYKDGEKLDGKTSATLNLTSITPEQAGKYTVVVSDANSATKGSLTSNAATVTVEQALEITSQPLSVTVIEGDEAELSVTAVGTGTLKYQWYKGNTKLNGETSATLTLSKAALTDGGEYKVIVSDDNSGEKGTVTSNTVTITVQKALKITTQPQSITLVEGDNGSLSVTADGHGTLTYQWYKDGEKLDGKTSATLSLSGITMEQAGEYTVMVTDANSAVKGSLTSSVATVNVEEALEITAQPTSITVIEGEEAVLRVEATGTGTLKYQWYKGSTELNGETSATLTLSKAVLSDAGEYKVIVSDDNSNTHGTLTSQAVTITVQKALKITTQPQSITLVEGDNGSLSVTADGHGSLTYQWYKDGVELDGATSATLSLSAITKDRAGKYTVVVSDGNSATKGSLTSSEVTVTVEDALEITKQPTSVTVIEGEEAVLRVEATGTGTLKYQWYKGNTELNGATSATLTLTDAALTDAGEYKVVVSDDNSDTHGTLTGNVATVTVQKALKITTQPQGVSLWENEDGSLSVTADGHGALTYQWYKGDTAIEGATSATLTLKKAALTDAGEYKVVVSDANSTTRGTLASQVVTVVVHESLKIQTQPKPLTIVEGKDGSLSVEIAGTDPITYQWYKDGQPIEGATAATLSFDGITMADSGNYQVKITDKRDDTIYSNEVAVVVEEALEITKEPANLSLIEGQSGNITIEAVGAGTLTYQWYKDGVPVAGATKTVRAAVGGNSATFTITDAALTDAGEYKVVVSDANSDENGSVTSKTVTVTVDKKLVISKNPEDVTLVEGKNTVLSVTAEGEGTLTYQWYKDGVAMEGEVGAALMLMEVTFADAGEYTVTVTDKNTTITVAPAIVTVEEMLEITKQPESVTLIEGEDSTIIVEAVGAGELIYAWYKDGALVDGATKAIYVLNSAELADAGTYKVVISDKNGNLTSKEVTVTVEKALQIVKQPEGLTLEEGENGSITVIASGEGTLSYQWYKDGVVIKGANAATLPLANLEFADEGTYQVEITDKNTTLTSIAVTVVVEEEDDDDGDEDKEEDSTIIVSPKTGEGNQVAWLLTIAGLLAGMSAILLGKQRKEAEE